jgi:chromosome segregation ATPase
MRPARSALVAAWCALGLAIAQGAEPRAAAATATAAVRLVMLSERIAKLHAQVGQGVLAERSRRDLTQAGRDFDATLRAVSAKAAKPEERDNYLLLAALWREHREWIARAPSREGARQMRERTEELAWIAQKGARMVQGEARAATNAGAFRAAQAGVLAQRVAKDYLWRRWGMRDERLDKERRDAEENLDRLLAALKAARGNSVEVEAELQSAEAQLGFLRQGAKELDASHAPPRAIEFVAKSADHILQSMERLQRLYGEAAPSAGS